MEQAKEAGCYEAIFITDSGMISEASRSNVMAIINGEIRTMPCTGNILPGITRQWTLKLARELAIPIREVPFDKEELHTATEAFLTNTTANVYPIVEVDGCPIGQGVIGPVSNSLMEAFSKLVENETMPSMRRAESQREFSLSSPSPDVLL